MRKIFGYLSFLGLLIFICLGSAYSLPSPLKEIGVAITLIGFFGPYFMMILLSFLGKFPYQQFDDTPFWKNLFIIAILSEDTETYNIRELAKLFSLVIAWMILIGISLSLPMLVIFELIGGAMIDLTQLFLLIRFYLFFALVFPVFYSIIIPSELKEGTAYQAALAFALIIGFSFIIIGNPLFFYLNLIGNLVITMLTAYVTGREIRNNSFRLWRAVSAVLLLVKLSFDVDTIISLLIFGGESNYSFVYMLLLTTEQFTVPFLIGCLGTLIAFWLVVNSQLILKHYNTYQTGSRTFFLMLAIFAAFYGLTGIINTLSAIIPEVTTTNSASIILPVTEIIYVKKITAFIWISFAMLGFFKPDLFS